MTYTLTGFDGRVALITGAGRNIGKAVALAFARAGADVAVNVRSNEVEGRQVIGEIESLGRRACLLIGDVADKEVPERLVDSTEHELGSIDYLVNCAANRSTKLIDDLTSEDWEHAIASCLSAPFYLAKAAGPRMRSRGFGRIINFGGVDNGRVGPGHAHTLTAKSAVISLTKSIAIEFGRGGITANVVCPFSANTSRNAEQIKVTYDDTYFANFPIPRNGEPPEYADVCIFLASNEASYITGQVVRVNGGREI